MVHLTINGKIVKAKEGEMLLAVIRREGISIPAECHHEAVEPFGACRLCTVEITKKEWDGWKNYVTSCLFPAQDGLIVETHSPRVIELRRTLLDLQLARCPNSPEVRRLAEEYGITRTSFEERVEADNCILCGLCTRICDQMGFAAISTVDRGHGRRIAPPLDQAPPDCVGCLACALNCPTNAIEYRDIGDKRVIWKKEFELITCAKCGKPTITRDFAEALSKQRGIPAEYFEICDECHRNELTQTMSAIAQWTRETTS
ncbi:MAG: 2Fe-2S iron-sulfur cluster-binding protein [Candidatus Zixiibacteriota bacterium]